MRYFIDLSQMRCSVRCERCDEIIKTDWSVCPKCQVSFDDAANLTLGELYANLRKDIDEYFVHDKFWEGGDFIKKASEKCIFDWEWGHFLGWAEGHYLFGKCYDDYDLHAERIPDTTGPEQSEICEAKAVEMYRLAALKGFAPAEQDYGYCLLQGRGGLTKNPFEAFRLVKRAADHGYIHAKYNLSSLYKCGHGTPKDEARALQLHFEVAEQGFPPAQTALASLYFLGQDGVPRNHALAFKWYQKAAEQGYTEGIYHVGWCYFDGIGVPKNKAESRKWFVAAAQRNHSEALRILQREDKKLFGWRF
ncbi:MAG: tetratricopeptide repeat protein [Formivibrio sp.]|nr:tetratricopeptide repeat protein [Formivibrio sp.]